MVNFQKIEITSIRFASLEKQQAKEVLEEIKKDLPKEGMLVSLDRILTAVDTSAIRAKEININTEPPPIFYSKKPAILVQFDGEPMLIPISGSPLSYAVNTNWDVFQDGDTKLWYLRNDTYWLSTKDFKKWQPVKKLPPAFESLANDDNWKEVKSHIPAGKMKGSMPVIFVSNKPSELILVDGAPDYQQIDHTDLLLVEHTQSGLFMHM